MAVSGESGNRWGSSIVGYGKYRYTSKSGCTGDWMRIGWAPRKAGLSVYLMCDFDNELAKNEFKALGKYKAGRACLSIKKLSDIDTEVLRKIVDITWSDSFKRYPSNHLYFGPPQTNGKKSKDEKPTSAAPKATAEKADKLRTGGKLSGAAAKTTAKGRTPKSKASNTIKTVPKNLKRKSGSSAAARKRKTKS